MLKFLDENYTFLNKMTLKEHVTSDFNKVSNKWNMLPSLGSFYFNSAWIIYYGVNQTARVSIFFQNCRLWHKIWGMDVLQRQMLSCSMSWKNDWQCFDRRNKWPLITLCIFDLCQWSWYTFRCDFNFALKNTAECIGSFACIFLVVKETKIIKLFILARYKQKVKKTSIGPEK